MTTPLRSTLAAAGLALFASLPCAAASESREVGGFTAIALSAPIRVELALGERESLVLEGDGDALARIETTVENGSLRIRLRQPLMSWNHKVVARVTARRIAALSIGGSGDIRARQLSGTSLAIDVAGSGDVTVESGRFESLALSIAGSGDVRAGKLAAQRVSVSIAGSGDATVWARESLSVSVVGSGDVRYYGDPVVRTNVVGSGDIRRLALAPS